MESPTEAFLKKVDKIASTSYKLRVMLNKYGGYQALPARLKDYVQQSVVMLESKEPNK